MEGLAHAGNGTAEFVKEGERMQPKVRDFPNSSLTPCLDSIVQFALYLDE